MARPRGGTLVYTDAVADQVVAGVGSGLTEPNEYGMKLVRLADRAEAG